MAPKLNDILKFRGTSPLMLIAPNVAQTPGGRRGNTEPAGLLAVIEPKFTFRLRGRNSRNSLLQRGIEHRAVPTWQHRADSLSKHLSPRPTLFSPTRNQPDALSTSSAVARPRPQPSLSLRWILCNSMPGGLNLISRIEYPA